MCFLLHPVPKSKRTVRLTCIPGGDGADEVALSTQIPTKSVAGTPSATQVSTSGEAGDGRMVDMPSSDQIPIAASQWWHFTLDEHDRPQKPNAHTQRPWSQLPRPAPAPQ